MFLHGSLTAAISKNLAPQESSSLPLPEGGHPLAGLGLRFTRYWGHCRKAREQALELSAHFAAYPLPYAH